MEGRVFERLLGPMCRNYASTRPGGGRDRHTATVTIQMALLIFYIYIFFGTIVLTSGERDWPFPARGRPK